jgi:chemotaxis protein MotB
MKKHFFCFLLLGVLVPFVSGCATIDKAKRVDLLEKRVTELQDEIQRLQQEKDSELERAKKDLTATLSKELGAYQAKLEMTERGLVITFLAEIFFDSGKADMRSEGKPILEKVAKVLNKDVAGSDVAIEGHTDSDPIKRSGWKSNWELSSSRALAVLHYFVDEGHIKPPRLSADAYGEFRPVASNDTREGKQKNRRVEIVILPSNVKKIKD